MAAASASAPLRTREPCLGIVVVHYHAEALLRRCIASLLASQFQGFEVVVVDNGSSADLGWVEDDRRFVLLRSEANVGFAAASNAGVAHLSKDLPLLLSLNPDVVLEPSTLGVLIELLQTSPEVAAATCRLLLPDGTLDPACRRADPTLFSALMKQLGLSRLAPGSRRLAAYNLGHLDDTQSHEIDACSGAFLMVRRSAFESVRGFDERFFLYGEDLDVCRRLRAAGARLLYTPAATAVHHKGSGRVRSAAVTAHFYRAMWTYYRKWGRHRRNPLVLGGLLLALTSLGGVELLRNETARRRSARSRGGPVLR